jgi:hypothetical protein
MTETWIDLEPICWHCYSQVCGLKEKLLIILNKTENDSKLISALKGELIAARDKEASTTDTHFG